MKALQLSKCDWNSSWRETMMEYSVFVCVRERVSAGMDGVTGRGGEGVVVEVMRCEEV